MTIVAPTRILAESVSCPLNKRRTRISSPAICMERNPSTLTKSAGKILKILVKQAKSKDYTKQRGNDVHYNNARRNSDGNESPSGNDTDA